MRDPGLPVKVNVAPSQDELLAEQRAMDQESVLLHVSSTAGRFCGIPRGLQQ
ncbi:hypothetical protein PI125_g6232 [Phytophthora idaei]|nr:hypothetical protein PI125_g6232 [Phytophthora idaei]